MPVPFLIRLLLALAFALPAYAQAPQGKPGAPAFVPESGQAGKDVVWVPTPQVLVDKMLDMAKVTPADFVMDLGSGDGRLVIAAAKRGAIDARALLWSAGAPFEIRELRVQTKGASKVAF